MTTREKILYRGIWNRYQRKYHYAHDADYRAVACERLLTLEKILTELTHGKLNTTIFDSWAKQINYCREV